MNITEQINSDIKQLKKCRYIKDKRKQYNQIASDFRVYFKQVNQYSFRQDLILSFFEGGYFPVSTTKKHVKNIITTLKEKGIIAETVREKTAKQRRVYQLKSNDFNSYMALMKSNGFNEVVYYNWYSDSDGIPRKRKVATSKINGLPVDKNGEVVDDFDLSVLKQTIPRRKQGVYSYGNKSIAIEKRRYNVKAYKVIY